ncbi:MAG: hypothetical protein HQL31_06465 [Planctomycetes bacterium]|nr:hypothetical protein [Planctomycetota bacterium]
MGDSITRGSYLSQYEDGPRQGQVIGLPNPLGGGWRKPLQDRLRAAGVAFEFAGELEYGAFGRDGVVDPDFQPRHHGLAGFGNERILNGGVVPTPPDVLETQKVTEIRVPDIITVLKKHQPNVVLLMSGANGFDAPARDRLIHTLMEHLAGHLFVATIPPQAPPRLGFEQVDDYNASLASVVTGWRASGRSIHRVDVNHALRVEDLTPDGVHPNAAGMEKISEVWWQALLPVVI